MYKKNIFFIFLILLLQYNITAETTRKNIDVFILLDKSISMEENIEAVTDYINSFIIDNMMIPGDNILIISFYGQTEILINDTLESENHKEDIKKIISRVAADGRFTDIGNVLDRLAAAIPEYSSEEKYMLLITDGIQEAPYNSKYYSPDGVFNHEFLEQARTIMMQGWKIQVLGIGQYTDAEKVAAELSGQYTEIITDNVTPEEIKLQMIRETEDFLSIFRVTEDPAVIFKGFIKKSFLTMKVNGINVTKESEIIINSIRLKTRTIPEKELLKDEIRLVFTADEEKALIIPFVMPADLSSGMQFGELVFGFKGNNALSPSEFYIQLQIKSFFETYLLPVAVAVLLLIILILIAAVYIFKKRESSSKITKKRDEIIFCCITENKNTNKNTYSINPGDKLYLFVSPSGDINISDKKSVFTKAVLTKTGDNISINIIDKMFISGTKYGIDNILDQSLEFINKSGKTFTILFKRK